jgi:Family of unknown function (DUF6349)
MPAVTPRQFALFDEADLLPKPEPPLQPPAWVGFPEGPDRSDHEPQGWTGPCLYASPARGLAARHAEFELWRELYGNGGCAVDSHAWEPRHFHYVGGLEGAQLDRHEPIPLSCSLRRHGPERDLPLPPCGHGTDEWLRYRCACLARGCDWEGPERGDENAAVEDGMDHSWPGWRDLPVVPRVPHVDGSGASKAAQKSRASWAAKVNAVYPAGWLESGGPIRTLREKYGTRHVEAATPWGGYDLAVITEAEAAA